MIRKLVAIVCLLTLAAGAGAGPAEDISVLTKQVEDFLGSASRGDSTAHDRFWADDLIYTGSSGRRVGKADIMRDLRATPPPKPEDPKTAFAAEDVRIHPYGDMAVVAFRLVGTTTAPDGMTRVGRYLNTGTFRKLDGQWRAVSWQATRLPRAEEDARKELAAAEAAFQSALRARDAAKLTALTDADFVWMNDAGESVGRARLIEELGSGKLPNASLETDSSTISVRGDAAVVRGVSSRRRAGDTATFQGHYTLTFVNQDGEWKAMAMHTSRP
jgi:ketosteroid isomerase-like protein